MATNQLAPPDMPWLAVRSPLGQPNGLGPPLLNYAAPPDAGGQTLGSAVVDTAANVAQALPSWPSVEEQRQMLQPLPGWQGTAVDAAKQWAEGVMMGTTAPGEPGMTAAIRLNGKVYRAPDDNPTHFGALAQVPPDQRAAAMGDGANRVYVTDQGKVLDRYKAADYARSFGIYDQGVPSYAATSPEYIAEWLPGYRAMLQRFKDSLN
jgi:hypothetical protein